MSKIIQHMEVMNLEHMEQLWEDTTADQEFIDKTLNETVGLLDQVTLSPKAASASIYGSFFSHFVIGMVLVFVLYLICSPGSVMKWQVICCSCGKPTEDKVVTDEELNA